MKKLLCVFALLSLGLMKTNAQTTISGKVLSYNKTSGFGCLYVDPEMVKAGVTIGLGNKTVGSECSNKKYGNGVSVTFSGLKKNADYPHPPKENVLILVKGKWVKKGNKYELYATEWEPFF